MKKKKLLASSLALAMTIGATMNLSLVNAQSRIDQIMEEMTLDQKITQMIMPDFRQWQQEGETAVSDLTVLNDEVAKIIDDYDFGGVILFANNVKIKKRRVFGAVQKNFPKFSVPVLFLD